MKNKIIGAVLILATFAFTGCTKGQEETVPETTTLPVVAYSADTSSTTTAKPVTETTPAETTSEPEEQEKLYIPVVDFEVDKNLGEFTVNGTVYNIKDLTVASFTEQSGAQYVSYSTSVHNTPSFYFYGKGFGFDGEDCPISLEVLKDGEAISDFETSEYADYVIKGFKVSEFFSTEDCTATFCDGIALGMKQEDVEALLGSGSEIEDSFDVIKGYKTADCTMTIGYDRDSETSKLIVDYIYLLNN